jgi:metallo-beta-lactamase class B
MERKTFISLLVVLLCLGLSMTAMAQSPVQDPSKTWLRSGPYLIVDTPAIKAEMEKARELAGDNWSFLQIQRLECGDIDDTYTIVRTPGANLLPPDSQSTGRQEVPAVPTKVFDNVYYIGGFEVGGWVIDTGDGYIMLDSGYADSYEWLKANMKALGLNPAKVRYMLITHAGPDHAGAAKLFQDEFGTKIIFNQKIVQMPYLPKPPDTTTIMKDGDTLTLGNTTITMVYTPRSYLPPPNSTTPGEGFSYFIPVKIDGKRHLWATFGQSGFGTIPLWQNSMAHFLTFVDKLHPDIAISSHPFLDGSVRRMEEIRECNARHGWWHELCGLRNPFLIGKEAARRYFEIMNQCSVVQQMRKDNGQDGNGFLACTRPQVLDPLTNTCK